MSTSEPQDQEQCRGLAEASAEQGHCMPHDTAMASAPNRRLASKGANISLKNRNVAFLVADGFADSHLGLVKRVLTKVGARTRIVAPWHGYVYSVKEAQLRVDLSLRNASALMFDAIYVPGGNKSIAALRYESDALTLINQAYRDRKTLAVSGAGVALLRVCDPDLAKFAAPGAIAASVVVVPGIVIIPTAPSPAAAVKFIQAIARHSVAGHLMQPKAQAPSADRHLRNLSHG